MRNVIIIFVLLILLSIGIFYSDQVSQKQISPIINNSPAIVGADRDIYGCIGSAGYSWCSIKNKCLRIWEEKCEITKIDTPIVVTTGTIILSKVGSCNQKKGVWFPAENICEVNQLTESQCKAAGGEFNSCASTCRHDPKAQVCNMMCALTCTFR